ncbi:MAG: Bro-N domain-containing protein [Verrucomicrobiota bacterium]
MNIFDFHEHAVRVVEKEGQPWFVAMDVCNCLEIGNSRKSVQSLDSDEKDGVTISDTIGRAQKMTVISESGVYRLIFKSRKASAQKFRKWVTSEVLPSIRRTGGYHLPGGCQTILERVRSRGFASFDDALMAARRYSQLARACMLRPAELDERFFSYVESLRTERELRQETMVAQLEEGVRQLSDWMRRDERTEFRSRDLVEQCERQGLFADRVDYGNRRGACAVLGDIFKRHFLFKGDGHARVYWLPEHLAEVPVV